MLLWLIRTRRDIDVVHVHMARDLITLPFAALAQLLRIPVVVQCHGMIDPSERRLAKFLDVVLTRRVLKRSRGVLWLTETERRGLVSVLRDTGLPTLSHVPNAIAVRGQEPMPSGPPRFVFVGRLHPRKRAALFAQVAANLVESGVEAEFRIAGPDEGELAAVEAVVDSLSSQHLALDPPLEPEGVLDYLASSHCLVLPSVDEPFPMTVLESLSIGRPVVITTSNGLAEIVRQGRAGCVVEPTAEALEGALRHLAEHPEQLQALSASAFSTCESHFSLPAMVEKLESTYTTAATEGSRA
jgi:glycosyltransferase involved in cell wall biosynthesis